MTNKEKPDIRQQKLFANPPGSKTAEQTSPKNEIQESVPQKNEKSPRRKFQVSNGYLLEFDQLARILHTLLEHQGLKKVSKETLEEETGFVDRQVETLVSMGAAMGIIIPNRQVLSHVGSLIAKHDIFIETKASLEWCHYIGAGSYKNLIWFEIFNALLTAKIPSSQDDWTIRFREELSDKYSKRTMNKGLYEEIRFVVDAYLERNFRKLELLHKSSDELLYLRRYTNYTSLIHVAMIYDFCSKRDAMLLQVNELLSLPGSHAVLFGLDGHLLEKQIEDFHSRGWLRYETTHNLNQIRLKPGFSAFEFLSAHFEEREPVENTQVQSGGN
jgi:hypothetical protein